ncbi:hypothetical protein RHIZ_02635 [Rhizobium skierniewicense]|uniref:hypothetical protein n=1 Tax=Rhizobium skierniewicense TaxID=984260 RepID=UPI001FAE4608|nr:hypothetical protein [Rhizobium skierniewicense]MCI9864837.1 hypothetical protein [Rhizobium skierniewicense]
MAIPIIYVRYGELREHTQVSLRQTLERNDNVFFLGNHDPEVVGVNYFDISKYDHGIEEFKNTYVHLSTNRYIFEVYCIARWFSLRNLVRELDLDHFYYCDDDVFNFSRIDEVYNLYKGYEAAFLFPSNLELASACCSFWTRKALEDFCSFIISEYTTNLKRYLEIWNAVSSRDERGGVSDMTFLYFFSQGRNMGSLTEVTPQGCFDMNPLISQNAVLDEYEMERPYLLRKVIKKMIYKDKDAFSFNRKAEKLVRIFAAPEHAKFEVIKSERNIVRKTIYRLLYSAR